MIFQETTRTRRLVGRIEEGEEFVAVLTELCEEHDVGAGRIEAIGAFSRVELARFDAARGGYQTSFSGEGNFEVISLQGNISKLGDAVALRLECLLGVDAPVGMQYISGQVRAADAISLEFVLDIFEDLAVERRLDADSGRLNIRSIRRVESAQAAPASPADSPESDRPASTPAPAAKTPEPAAASKPEPADDPAPITGKGLSWKDAAAEASQPPAARPARDNRAPSAQEIYADLDLTEPTMKAGDILEHPKLGRCRVMKIEDGDFVHVRLPRGRIRKLSLDIVEVEFDRDEDGRSVFRAIIGR